MTASSTAASILVVLCCVFEARFYTRFYTDPSYCACALLFPQWSCDFPSGRLTSLVVGLVGDPPLVVISLRNIE